ncbi:hypothetical protein HETIRDRAFT_174386 [Heterobasidion irregulare TC 32-1]|uniref:Uncharacterized protein n=1 Tax=Heterobasidion irregulare (strain TC 32-1) TaxID=747525 RepID=W4JS01_HETIT|nr:uncharacterized protein HETIRDRAFT_174386 [Heterobasidion irregulare TC 32-1]ETW76308.1 hypothetical protein HETIRDRAFT_174386 [Heterobasidion irregulare TC 32-1]
MFGGYQDIYTSNIPNDFFERAKSMGNVLKKYATGLLDRVNAEYEAPVQAKVAEFRESLDRLAEGTTRLHDLGMSDFGEELARVLATIAQQIQDEFPPPDKAPSHERRVEMVDDVLQRVEEVLVHVAEAYGLPAERIREDLHDRILPHVKRLVVITGDLAEQHPVLLETLLFAAVGALIPESWFLRPLLNLFGFGPYGPVKGSAAAWAQRRFYGATVASRSWFAHLQSAAMRPRLPPGTGAAIGGAVGAGLSLFGCRARAR